MTECKRLADSMIERGNLTIEEMKQVQELYRLHNDMVQLMEDFDVLNSK